MISADFYAILPEVVLALYAMAALLGAVYTGKDEVTGTLTWATVAVFVGIAAWIGLSDPTDTPAFGGMFIDDPFAQFAKVVILLGAAAVLAMSADYMARRGLARFEFPLIAALAVTAAPRACVLAVGCARAYVCVGMILLDAECGGFPPM